MFVLLDVSYATHSIRNVKKKLLDHALSMDNVCNRRLFSFPSEFEMAEEQEYLKNIPISYTIVF